MIVAFDADLNRLIQLYVVGVFTSFTLSQTGMVRHWLAEGRKGGDATKGWRRSIVINLIGAVTTGVVLVVVTATKLKDGAWLSILVMATIVPVFQSIHRHYLSVQAAAAPWRGPSRDASARTRSCCSCRDLSAADRRGARLRPQLPPAGAARALPRPGAVVPPDLQERWRAFAGGGLRLEPLGPGQGDICSERVRTYLAGIRRERRGLHHRRACPRSSRRACRPTSCGSGRSSG